MVAVNAVKCTGCTCCSYFFIVPGLQEMSLAIIHRRLDAGCHTCKLEQASQACDKQHGTCRLIRSIYPELQDHPRTLEYPDVLGMAGNLLLLDHDHPEGGQEEGRSRYNRWEASMALGLAKYLMQQGYGPGEGEGGCITCRPRMDPTALLCLMWQFSSKLH
jgi:hypothetical protein